MIIENTLQTAKYKMAFVLLISFMFLPTLYSMLMPGGMKHNYLVGLYGLIPFAGYIFLRTCKLYFFYFSDETDKIVIRYYNAHPWIRHYRAIEFKQTQFAGYELVTSRLNLVKELIIHQQTSKGVFKYPPVSLSALPKPTLELLKKKLIQMTRQIKPKTSQR